MEYIGAHAPATSVAKAMRWLCSVGGCRCAPAASWTCACATAVDSRTTVPPPSSLPVAAERSGAVEVAAMADTAAANPFARGAAHE